MNIWLIGPIELSIQPIDTKRQSVKYRLFSSTLNGTGDVLSEEGLSTEVKYDLKVSLPGLWLLSVDDKESLSTATKLLIENFSLPAAADFCQIVLLCPFPTTTNSINRERYKFLLRVTTILHHVWVLQVVLSNQLNRSFSRSILTLFDSSPIKLELNFRWIVEGTNNQCDY